jgi:hypothetical protein
VTLFEKTCKFNRQMKNLPRKKELEYISGKEPRIGAKLAVKINDSDGAGVMPTLANEVKTAGFPQEV